MSNWLNAAAATTAVLLAAAAPAEAQLLGVKVEGTYLSDTSPGTNLFTTLNSDPQGYLPTSQFSGRSGLAGNSTLLESGPIVTVKDTILHPQINFSDKGPAPILSYEYIEFYYSGFLAESVSYMTVGVDFNDTGFTFATRFPSDSDQLLLQPYTFMFTAQTPGAFNGLELVDEENFSANTTWSRMGDTITITPTTLVPQPFRSATFAFVEPPTEAPEPATMALLATGLLGLGLHRYRRRAACPASRAATS